MLGFDGTGGRRILRYDLHVSVDALSVARSRRPALRLRHSPRANISAAPSRKAIPFTPLVWTTGVARWSSCFGRRNWRVRRNAQVRR